MRKPVLFLSVLIVVAVLSKSVVHVKVGSKEVRSELVSQKFEEPICQSMLAPVSIQTSQTVQRPFLVELYFGLYQAPRLLFAASIIRPGQEHQEFLGRPPTLRST